MVHVSNATRVPFQVLATEIDTSFSSEDDAVRRAVMADVDTYVDEMIIKFVSGREPLSNWDTYVEKVNGMGIAEVIDIYQKTLNG